MTQKFTTPCFIRKNTAELRKKLEELGYKLNNGKAWGRFLVTFRIEETNEWKYVASPEWDLQNNPDIDVSIDCGTNEDLFLAIAALREDSDYMQFFTDGTEFILCDRYDWIDMYSVLCSGLSNAKDRVKELDKFQKATTEEIIKHFKN